MIPASSPMNDSTSKAAGYLQAADGLDGSEIRKSQSVFCVRDGAVYRGVLLRMSLAWARVGLLSPCMEIQIPRYRVFRSESQAHCWLGFIKEMQGT